MVARVRIEGIWGLIGLFPKDRGDGRIMLCFLSKLTHHKELILLYSTVYDLKMHFKGRESRGLSDSFLLICLYY